MRTGPAAAALASLAILAVGAAAGAPTASAAPRVDPSPTAGQPTTGPQPNSPAATPDEIITDKLRGWGLPSGTGSTFDAETLRAVCVWRELNGRIATREPLTQAERSELLAAPNTATFRVPSGLAGVPFMINSTCQTAIYQTGGAVVRIFAVSTGKYRGGTRKNGMFRVFARTRGWVASSSFPDPDGRPNMYKSVYFFGPLAVHGSPTPIAPYPQSHGCTRTSPQDQDWLFRRLKLGTRVFSYGNWWSGRVRAFGGYPL